ncbi:UNVERIFIED_CONTAM: hypothetical protein Slati_3707500 [Sesamum latifolium]|uniref:Secreted protein n=1 Tax=Sesamum latifolium TaxID=2727402 RepID=A0AAW2U2E8_9LAMI
MHYRTARRSLVVGAGLVAGSRVASSLVDGVTRSRFAESWSLSPVYSWLAWIALIDGAAEACCFATSSRDRMVVQSQQVACLKEDREISAC